MFTLTKSRVGRHGGHLCGEHRVRCILVLFFPRLGSWQRCDISPGGAVGGGGRDSWRVEDWPD